MKINIETKFWREEKKEVWIERYLSWTWITGMLMMITIVWNMFTRTDSTMLYITAGLGLAVSLLITISHNAHKKEEREESGRRERT